MALTQALCQRCSWFVFIPQSWWAFTQKQWHFLLNLWIPRVSAQTAVLAICNIWRIELIATSDHMQKVLCAMSVVSDCMKFAAFCFLLCFNRSFETVSQNIFVISASWKRPIQPCKLCFVCQKTEFAIQPSIPAWLIWQWVVPMSKDRVQSCLAFT